MDTPDRVDTGEGEIPSPALLLFTSIGCAESGGALKPIAFGSRPGLIGDSGTERVPVNPGPVALVLIVSDGGDRAGDETA